MSKSEQTKRGIARAFVSLVESQPLEKVNVSKLVDAMGINRKTFYYHFTDKTDLVIWTFRSALADALQERFEREQLVEPGPESQDPYQDLPCYVLNKLGVRSLDHSGFFQTFLNVLAGNRTRMTVEQLGSGRYVCEATQYAGEEKLTAEIEFEVPEFIGVDTGLDLSEISLR